MIITKADLGLLYTNVYNYITLDLYVLYEQYTNTNENRRMIS